jgi:structure-specific recognition protein 1
MQRRPWDTAHVTDSSSAQGVNGLKANVKAVQGELYFLEKGLIFIAKQPILIDFSKTQQISFSR